MNTPSSSAPEQAAGTRFAAAPELWFAAYGENYPGQEAPFLEAGTWAWTSAFSSAYPALADGVLKRLNGGAEYKPYFEHELQDPPASWTTVNLMTMGMVDAKAAVAFPELMDELTQIPGLITAYFSRLQAGASIKTHSGPTNAFYRCHFGLVVPSSDPEQCGISVDGVKRGWQEQEWTIFLDAHRHEAWNHTHEDRMVLILDVLRPEFVQARWWICSSLVFTYVLYLFARKRPFRFFLTAMKHRFLWMPVQHFGALMVYPLLRLRAAWTAPFQ